MSNVKAKSRELYMLVATPEVPVENEVCKVVVCEVVHVPLQSLVVAGQLTDPDEGVELEVPLRQTGGILQALGEPQEGRDQGRPVFFKLKCRKCFGENN